MTGKPVDEKEVEKFEKYVKQMVHHLDTYYLKDRKFLCGDEISIADLLCIGELTQLNGVGKEHLYLGNSKVKQWVERVQNFCGKTFEDSHKFIRMVGANFKKRAAKM